MVEVAEAGIDMRHIELGMRQTGATDEQVKHARETAYAGSQKFPNLSPIEIFEHINDLRGILGDMDKAIHEAPDLLPEFSALKAKAGNHGAKNAVNEIYTAVKSAETANEITAEGVQKHANALTRLAFWYGDKLNPSQYFTAQKNGGQMLNLTSDRFRFGAFAALTQEIGQRAGTQFATFAAKGVAGLKMTGRGLTVAESYGLLKPETVEWSKAGLVKPGAQFKDNNLAASDADIWLYEKIIPKLAKGTAKAPAIDVNNKAELLRVLGQIFTDKNAYGFLFEMAAQRSKIEKDYAGFEKTGGDTTNYRKNDPYSALQGVRAQGGAVAAAASEPAIPAIVENLNKLNAALGSFAKTLADNPIGAQAGFAGLAGTGAGVGAAGLYGLGRMALPLVAGSPIGLTIGAATLIITGSLLFPWDAVKQSIFGIQPGSGAGRDAHLDSMRRTAALNQVIGSRDFSRNRFGVLGDADAYCGWRQGHADAAHGSDALVLGAVRIVRPWWREACPGGAVHVRYRARPARWRDVEVRRRGGWRHGGAVQEPRSSRWGRPSAKPEPSRNGGARDHQGGRRGGQCCRRVQLFGDGSQRGRYCSRRSRRGAVGARSQDHRDAVHRVAWRRWGRACRVSGRGWAARLLPAGAARLLARPPR
ncbi:MAG: hypothetical protein PGN33_22845 [Methylobacterium radiotolerans]